MALVLLAVTACSSPTPTPITVLARHCTTLSGAHDVHLQLQAPAKGVLRVAIEQFGISVVGVLTTLDQRSPAATSPADRYGLTTLLAATQPKQAFSLQVSSRDSHKITGQVCISSELLSTADRKRVAAEQAHARGAQEAHQHNWQAASRYYVAAARRFDQLGLRPLAQAARYGLAQLLYFRLMSPREAAALAGIVLADSGTGANPGLRSTLLALQAIALLETESSDSDAARQRALQLLNHAEVLARKARFGAREIPRLEILRGFVHYLSGNVPAGMRSMERAAPRCAALQDFECYAHAKQNLGALSLDSNHYQVAEAHFADALRYLDPAVAPRLAAEILANYGLTSGLRGKFAQSEQSLRKAADLYIHLKDCDGVRYTFARLGGFLMQVGRTQDAYPYLQHAAATGCTELLALTDSVPGHFDAHGILAHTEATSWHKTHKDPTEPATACHRVRAQDAPSADSQFAVYLSLYALGEALLTEDHLDAAAICMEKAQTFTTSARQELNLANLRGRAFLKRGDPARAKAAFQQAIEVADTAGIAPSHEYLDHARDGLARAALLLRDSTRAQEQAVHMLRASSARGDIIQLISALQLLAESLQEAGRKTSAASILGTAIELGAQVPITELNGEQRAAYMATQHAVFAQLTDLLSEDALTDPHAIWRAFQAAERGRARSLRFSLNQSVLEHSTVAPQLKSDAQVTVMNTITELTRTYPNPALRNMLIDGLAKLTRDTQTNQPVVDARELINHLRELDATLIAYAAGRKDMFVFVVDKESIHVLRLASLASIAEISQALNARLRAPEINPASVQQSARVLAQDILWPIAHLVKERRIIVIPDDVLHTVPFAVLPWSEVSNDSLLLHHAETTVAPSAAFLTQKKKQDAQTAHFLSLIGDPIFQKEQWWRQCMHRAPPAMARAARSSSAQSHWQHTLPAIPGTREEVMSIKALAQESHAARAISLHTGCAATKSALIAAIHSAPRILHIATHGYVDSLRPRLSALALTPEPTQDTQHGLFSLPDILESKVRTNLVVLSACDSSQGKILPGEGILGPAQTFLHAGAASVLASYWRIPDADTAAFMQSFYQYLLGQKLTTSMALRSAQLEHAAAHSYHWAAFALYGLPDIAIH